MKNKFVVNFLITFLIFGFVNVFDQVSGQPELTKNYPLFMYMIWTGLVASFQYFNWRIAYWPNAVLLYCVQLYSIFHHPAQSFQTSFHWLIGALPFDYKIMIFIPVFIILSIMIQLVIIVVNRKREQKAFDDVEDEPNEDY